MLNVILRCKKTAAICLALILALSLATACGGANPTLQSGESAQSAESQQSENIENPEGVLLPFGGDGKLVWDASDFDYFTVSYVKKNLYAYITEKEDAQTFIDVLNGMGSKRLKAVKQTEEAVFDQLTLFDELTPGTLIYDFNAPFQMKVCKADDAGYLCFLRYGENPEIGYNNFSLYSVSLNDLQKLEDFFEKLKKFDDTITGKPVIYLYPERQIDVSVKLDYQGRLTVTYPAYDGGWNVRAYPDGRLINRADGLEYSYLFWEGFPDNPRWWNLSEGYCVAGADTASFLQRTLSELGLTPKEYNEFIVYWLPQMQDNPYNLITFQWDEYEDLAPLSVSPAPDSVLRVFMVFAPLEKPADIKAPTKRPDFERNGFTVVEWGGCEVE